MILDPGIHYKAVALFLHASRIGGMSGSEENIRGDSGGSGWTALREFLNGTQY